MHIHGAGASFFACELEFLCTTKIYSFVATSSLAHCCSVWLHFWHMIRNACKVKSVLHSQNSREHARIGIHRRYRCIFAYDCTDILGLRALCVVWLAPVPKVWRGYASDCSWAHSWLRCVQLFTLPSLGQSKYRRHLPITLWVCLWPVFAKCCQALLCI